MAKETIENEKKKNKMKYEIFSTSTNGTTVITRIMMIRTIYFNKKNNTNNVLVTKQQT